MKLIDLLEQSGKTEEALSFARENSIKRKKNIGYESEYTWESIEKVIDLLEKCGKLKDALSLAQEEFLKIEKI